LSGSDPSNEHSDEPEEQANEFRVQGRLVELDALRFTPAGIPILSFKLEHASTRMEAGAARKVACEIEALAFEADARLLATATLGMELKLEGFMDRKSRNSRKLVLHVRRVEFGGLNS